MPRLVRGSELTDFLRCRLKWKYAWVDGYVPKTPNDKLFFGNLFHKFIEVYYGTGCGFNQALDAMQALYHETDTTGMEQVALDELWNLAYEVVRNYDSTYYATDKGWQIVATEFTFAVPLPNGDEYTGTIDLIYEVDGALRFMDHKTTASIEKYEKNAIMDRQISRYWWALQQLQQGNGWVIDREGERYPIIGTAYFDDLQTPLAGFTYNIVLKDYPTVPKQLKSGALSKDKAQKTTYDLYTHEIARLGLNPADYEDFLQYLQENPKQFFKRVEVIRNQQEIDAAMDEFMATVEDMRSPRIYRNITSDCHWDCPFKDVCLAGMDGSNVDLLLQTLFKKDEGR